MRTRLWVHQCRPTGSGSPMYSRDGSFEQKVNILTISSMSSQQLGSGENYARGTHTLLHHLGHCTIVSHVKCEAATTYLLRLTTTILDEQTTNPSFYWYYTAYSIGVYARQTLHYTIIHYSGLTIDVRPVITLCKLKASKLRFSTKTVLPSLKPPSNCTWGVMWGSMCTICSLVVYFFWWQIPN